MNTGYNREWLTKKINNGETLKYIFFWGHSNKAGETVGKFIFSQWYPSPFSVDGITYATAEHWMMAGKAKLFNDQTVFNKIVASKKPGDVKELGRQIASFDARVWDNAKFEIVKQGSIHKFSQNEAFRDYLVSTGDRVLVEASPTDNIWGIGLAQDAPMIENPHTWKGENLLGFALMEARDFLKK